MTFLLASRRLMATLGSLTHRGGLHSHPTIFTCSPSQARRYCTSPQTRSLRFPPCTRSAIDRTPTQCIPLNLSRSVYSRAHHRRNPPLANYRQPVRLKALALLVLQSMYGKNEFNISHTFQTAVHSKTTSMKTVKRLLYHGMESHWSVRVSSLQQRPKIPRESFTMAIAPFPVPVLRGSKWSVLQFDDFPGAVIFLGTCLVRAT